MEVGDSSVATFEGNGGGCGEKDGEPILFELIDSFRDRNDLESADRTGGDEVLVEEGS
jgi:hypothetical protein